MFSISNKIYHIDISSQQGKMNENDELLLGDTPPSTPHTPPAPPQEDDLLLDEIDQDFSSTENAFQFPRNLQKTANETWSSTKNWKNSTTFIWQQDSSEQEEMEPIFSPNKSKTKGIKEQQSPEFPYSNLMNSLSVALGLILEKEKEKEMILFSSVKHIKSVSEHHDRADKKVKTQRTSKQQALEIQKRMSQRKKYEHMRKSATEPDENYEALQKEKPKRLKIEKYAVINEVDEKESPTLKTRKDQERQRTKQQFLASMTNWQEKRKIRQLERMEKEQIQLMSGVTFTPAINPKSKLLMKKKGTMLPIYQRDIKCKRPEIEGLVTPKTCKHKK